MPRKIRVLHEGEIHEVDDEVGDDEPQVVNGSESAAADIPSQQFVQLPDEHSGEISGNDLWGLIDDPIDEPPVGPPVIELLPEPLPVEAPAQEARR